MSGVPKVIFRETHELWEDTTVPIKAASDIFQVCRGLKQKLGVVEMVAGWLIFRA